VIDEVDRPHEASEVTRHCSVTSHRPKGESFLEEMRSEEMSLEKIVVAKKCRRGAFVAAPTSDLLV
jgi:hypothetical protein